MNILNEKVSVIRLLVLVALTTTLSSFAIPLGMDSYKVYLNGKLLFEQYAHKGSSQSVSLNESSPNDRLTVYYDHCGRIGTARTLAALDGDQELHKWTFQDTKTESESGMTCDVGAIKAIQKPGKTIRLMYNSKELASPIEVALIAPSIPTTAKARQ